MHGRAREIYIARPTHAPPHRRVGGTCDVGVPLYVDVGSTPQGGPGGEVGPQEVVTRVDGLTRWRGEEQVGLIYENYVYYFIID